MFEADWLTRSRVLWIILSWNLLRLVLGPAMGLMPQDAYYFLYAEHPDLSYFDHPPMVAYMLYLSKMLLGKNVLAIKVADFLVTLATQYAFYHLAKRCLTEKPALVATLLFSTTLMISILSVITTPDVPLILFWTLSLICLFEAIFFNRKMLWLLAGVLMGLAFDSKYTAVFLPAGLFLFLLLSKDHRSKLSSVWPYLSLLLMVICMSPVIIWNIQHDYASFLFQADRSNTITRFSVHPEFLLGVIGHQAFLIIPVVFVLLIIYLFKRFPMVLKRQWDRFNTKELFLSSFFLPLWGGFMLISLFYWVKINWQMPAYITGIILVTSMVNAKWLRWHLIISFLLHLLLVVQILFYPVLVRSDDTWVGWQELADQIEMIQEDYPGSFIFSGDNYKTSAQLSFHMNKKIYAQNIVGESALQFDFLGDDLNALRGRSALYLDSQNHFKDLEKGDHLPIWNGEYFESVEQLEPIIIYRGSRPVRKYLVYFCSQYKGIP